MRRAACGLGAVLRLGSAFERLPNVTDNPVVIAHASRLGITPAQTGLAWLLGHSPATLLIPGTRDLAHLADNVAVARSSGIRKR